MRVGITTPGQAKKTIQQTTPDRLTEVDLLGLIYGLTPFLNFLL